MSTELDFYSPLCLIAGGLLGIGYFGLLKYFLVRQQRLAISEQFEAVYRRFRSRQKLSWIMVAFGALWFLQVTLEERPVREWSRLFAKATIKVRDPAGK